MTDITKGLQCLRCYSVVFNIDDLLKHIINEPSHNIGNMDKLKVVLYLLIYL